MDIYNKPYNELTAQQKEMLETARQVLLDGNRLYGSNKEDTSHIGWAVGLVAHRLRELYESDSIATLIELGCDESGLFISFVMNEENHQSPDL